MNTSPTLIQFVLGLLLTVLPVFGQQIILNSGSVIGGGPSYGGGTYNTGSHPASLALDEQTGPINVETEQRDNYWIGPDGVSTSFFVIDLGAAYEIGAINLFNTHNWESMDRSTKDFRIEASNSVSFVNSTVGYALVSGVTILSGILPFTSDNPPGANVFTSANGLNTGGNAYRYLSFTYDSYRGIDDSIGHSGGLHEFRVYAIPEPSTALLLAAGGIGVAVVRRLRKRAT
jgi:hypothetical protein